MNGRKAGVAIAVMAVVIIVVAYAVIAISDDDENDDGRIRVSYDANGGEGNMDASRCDIGSSIAVKECAFSDDKDIKRFVSWNTAADGSGTSYNAGDPLTPESDIVLYAQWQYYDLSDFGIGSKIYYKLSGGYTYSSYVYDISGDVEDTVTSLGTSTRSYERTYTQVVSHNGKEYNRDTHTINGSEDRYTTYEGERSTLQTDWGLKDVIVTVEERQDDAGHTITLTNYRDATTHIRYMYIMSAPLYTAGSQTLKDYSLVMTLSGYDVNYAGSN